jgi:glycerophosphoryl diester phosphodiesterase
MKSQALESESNVKKSYDIEISDSEVYEGEGDDIEISESEFESEADDSERHDYDLQGIDKNKITLIAHRGYSSIAPENTKAAFKQAAAQANFDGIECDVYRTKDGVYVVHHDDNLRRIFGLNRVVYECKYQEIRSLFALGGNNPRHYSYNDRRLTRFEEYMDILTQTDKRAVIELKQAYSQEITDELFDMITSYGINDRIDIISFSYDCLEKISTAMDSYTDRHPGTVLTKPEIYLLTQTPEKVMSEDDDKTPVDWALERGYNLSVIHGRINSRIVNKVHEAGKKVYVWTVDIYEDAIHYIKDFDVDGVTSNQLLFQ